MLLAGVFACFVACSKARCCSNALSGLLTQERPCCNEDLPNSDGTGALQDEATRQRCMSLGCKQSAYGGYICSVGMKDCLIQSPRACVAAVLQYMQYTETTRGYVAEWKGHKDHEQTHAGVTSPTVLMTAAGKKSDDRKTPICSYLVQMRGVCVVKLVEYSQCPAQDRVVSNS